MPAGDTKAVEKALKSLLFEFQVGFKRTHSIRGLKGMLNEAGVESGLDFEECRLFDSIYLPSNYPLGGVAPETAPDVETCRRSIEIASRALENAKRKIGDMH